MASVVIYIINIARLLVLYPLALQGCGNAPSDPTCFTPMWTFHTAVYEWGFLVLLMGMWFAWFLAVGGPNRYQRRLDEPSPWVGHPADLGTGPTHHRWCRPRWYPRIDVRLGSQQGAGEPACLIARV